MGGCATKENKENKPADEADGCVFLWPAFNPGAYQYVVTAKSCANQC